MEEFKQVIVMRTDLKIGRGKMAAQAGHAAVLGAENVRKLKLRWLNQWFASGQAKIVVRTPSLQGLLLVRSKAEALNLPVAEVDDSGLTQLPPGTKTCLAIGPAPSNLVDQVTGDMKLL